MADAPESPAREASASPARARARFPAADAERLRLGQDARGEAQWKRWGPYLSERQWGTVREDYSDDGEAWQYFPHEQARSRAYRWGEDGIAGISEDWQWLCLALALWNGEDSFLKERLYGLSNTEGNHGEDVKELYWYLDATPTHSYLRMLYKYPQAPFPYAWLLDENRRRRKHDTEAELLDSGVFEHERYFDVFVEYAKVAPDDLLMRITVHNRAAETAGLCVIPQLWFRNTWSWRHGASRPSLEAQGTATVRATHPELETYWWYADGAPELIFTENDTQAQRVFGAPATPGYFKDGFHDYVVAGRREAVNPARRGTKAAAVYRVLVAPGEPTEFRLRLSARPRRWPFARFAEWFRRRKREADAFYAPLQRELADPDARLVQRQAWAGMIWGKQFYYIDVPEWLNGDPAQPRPPAGHVHGRNREWLHLNNADVLSMPDKWEYPWYAAWDLAFHCLPLAQIDPAFAKHQLVLLTREWYMHPNGQLPAYEWNFGDVNPPVHAWAALRVYEIERDQNGGRGDRAFLERVFHKLMLNFTWWVNRKDAEGRNIFQGGFLGLDNIGVFDRSKPVPTGGFINQADGTSWMAMYCLNLMRIALELAPENHVYEDIATKFFEHFLHIAEAMNNIAGQHIGLWDEEDEFYYDVLNLPDQRRHVLKVRSIVGLIPLFAVEVLEPELSRAVPEFTTRLQWFLDHRPELAKLVSRWHEPGRGERRLLSLLRGHRMKRLLRRMLDETEFLSEFGVRSLSRRHRDDPYTFACGGEPVQVAYEPAESHSWLFGGNSNWRGPIWFPVNYLIVESLERFHHYYGDDFRVECPTGSGRLLTIREVAEELTRRLTRIFLRDGQGRRPVFGDQARLQADPHFRDYILFHEYFDGENGRGLGASHQTGWTGLIANLLAKRPGAAQRTSGPL